MTRLELARPATRSVAVRPCSTSSPRARAGLEAIANRSLEPVHVAQARSAGWPRPAASGAPPGAPQPLLFLSFSPRPIGSRQVLVADVGSRRCWEPGTAAGTEKRCNISALRHGSQVPTPARARVMHMRARMRCPLPLSLGTGELSLIPLLFQWVERFPQRFPVPRRVGTWEPSASNGSASDRLSGCGNKVEGGNADLRLPGRDAGRKFRASIAAIGRDLVLELGRIQQLPTRRGRNGGKLPIAARLEAHVGRAMLEGCGQAPDLAAFPAPRRKPARLGRLAPIGRSGELAEAPGTPPNASRASRSTLAMDALGICFGRLPGGADRPLQGGHIHYRIFWRVSDRPRISCWQRGPGGDAADLTPEKRQNPRNSMDGGRAGVNSRRLVRGSTTPAETTKLRSAPVAVKRVPGAAA